MRAIQELDFVENTCRFNRYIEKRMHDNNISETINMGRPDILLAVYSLLQHSQSTTASVERLFFHATKTVSQGQKL